MTLQSTILTRKPEIARVLLLIFAFTAWSFTTPANIALALLALLFLIEIPAHWRQLRREPAFLLLLGVLVITGALAVRAAWLFPTTASDQWRAISAWSAPFLFIIPAWWLRRDPTQVWAFMGAAALGLVVGILIKSDWSYLPDILLHKMRYDFGFAALGLAFIASVMLVGFLLFRARITGLRIDGRARPLLGWVLWVLGLASLLFVLAVTQSRGAAVGLATAGILYAFIQWRRHHPEEVQHPHHGRLALGSALLLVALAVSLLWVTKDRQMADLRELRVGSQDELSYNSIASTAIRLNLASVGLRAFTASPLLGFGPGTSTTEFLLPQRVVAVSEYQLAHAPAASHLHSVVTEALVRFGLVGVLIAVLLLVVLGRAYRTLWSDPRAAPELRTFLTLGGVMLLLYCIYDFRLVNLDIRFFVILFFGVLYSFQLGSPGTRDCASIRRRSG
jgi:hypothetical protein